MEIVVTGVGLVTPLGRGREATWRRVRQGDSLASEPAPDFLPQELRAYVRSSPFVNPNGLPKIFHLALAAAREALQHAGLRGDEVAPERWGCSLSVSKPAWDFQRGWPADLNSFAPDAVPAFVRRQMNWQGPALNCVAACATGAHSILAAERWLREGACDVAVCGAAESSLNALIVSGFQRAGVLSAEPRPFDARRSGFMMGEGAGILVLERRADALARKAPPIAQLAACSIGSDFHHPTAFDASGGSIASVLRRCLSAAQLAPRELDYLNAHGTGTVLNDRVETRSIRSVFGADADSLAVSSTKGATGHLLGASAGVEAALACLALRDQFVPPTANLEAPDPECDLDYVPRAGRSRKLDSALSLSFGFGGPIGAVAFRSPS